MLLNYGKIQRFENLYLLQEHRNVSLITAGLLYDILQMHFINAKKELIEQTKIEFEAYSNYERELYKEIEIRGFSVVLDNV